MVFENIGIIKHKFNLFTIGVFMFLYIGLLCATVACSTYASEKSEVTSVTSEATPAATEISSSEPVSMSEAVAALFDNLYYGNLSDATVSTMEMLGEEVSSELPNLCRAKYGNQEVCSNFLRALAKGSKKSNKYADGVCENFLIHNRSEDPIKAVRMCTRLVPAFKAGQQKWEQDRKAAKKKAKADASDDVERMGTV